MPGNKPASQSADLHGLLMVGFFCTKLEFFHQLIAFGGDITFWSITPDRSRRMPRRPRPNCWYKLAVENGENESIIAMIHGSRWVVNKETNNIEEKV
jgi:hypothetical protein